MQEMNGDNESNASSGVVRSWSKRRELNEDVSKLCALSSLMSEENHRLHALNNTFQAELNQLNKRVDEASTRIQALERDNARLQEKNAAAQPRRDRQQQQAEGSSLKEETQQESLVAALEREVWGSLALRDGEQQFVRSRLQNLAMEFVQGLIQVEDELMSRRNEGTTQPATTSSPPPPPPQEEGMHENEIGEHQLSDGSSQREENEEEQACHLVNYIVPAAALSGALAAIIISLRVSSRAAAATSDQPLS